MRTFTLPILATLLVLAGSLALGGGAYAGTPPEPHDPVITFDPKLPDSLPQSPKVKYDFDLARTKYLVHVPANYTGKEPFGLLVVTDPNGLQGIPDWDFVLEQDHLLLVAAQGEHVQLGRWYGMQIVAARKMCERYKIDPRRIYIAGIGPPAMYAGIVGFAAPELFRGVIEIGDIAFNLPLPDASAPGAATMPLPDPAKSGWSPERIALLKRNTRFALITAPHDRFHATIVDWFHRGYEKEGLHARLFDLTSDSPDATTDPACLQQALDFLDGRDSDPTIQPAPPAWMAKNPHFWPQILLANDFHMQGQGSFRGASAFLMRTPEGAVVGVTARHVFEDHPPLAQFDRTPHQWALTSRADDMARAVLGKLAFDPAEVGDLDVVAAWAINQHGPFPALVLPARRSLLQIGEKIYVLGVPYEEHTRQNVYQGVVTKRYNNRVFEYLLDGSFKTRGFSGAPILDSHGRLAAIYLGHFNDKPVAGKLRLYALDTAYILAHLKSPAGLAGR